MNFEVKDLFGQVDFELDNFGGNDTDRAKRASVLVKKLLEFLGPNAQETCGSKCYAYSDNAAEFTSCAIEALNSPSCRKYVSQIGEWKPMSPGHTQTIFNIYKERECPVCMSIEPLNALDCGHKFCSACIGKLQNNNRLICPMCRQPHPAGASTGASTGASIDHFPIPSIQYFEQQAAFAQLDQEAADFYNSYNN
jgi:hypothetical protein